MPDRPSVDPKVYDLAEAWLDEDADLDLSPEQRATRRWSLAAAIQHAIEDWCDDDARPPHRLDESL